MRSGCSGSAALVVIPVLTVCAPAGGPRGDERTVPRADDRRQPSNRAAVRSATAPRAARRGARGRTLSAERIARRPSARRASPQISDTAVLADAVALGLAAGRGRARSRCWLLDLRAARRDPPPGAALLGRARLSGSRLGWRARPVRGGLRPPPVILPARLVDELRCRGGRSDRRCTRSRTCAAATCGPTRWPASRWALLAFNPPRGSSCGALSMEREIACDDWVVAGRAPAKPSPGRSRRWRTGWVHAHRAAPSAFGSRHAIVVRVERLLDARPRRLRTSPPALGGALVVLAAIALGGANGFAGGRVRAGSAPREQGPRRGRLAELRETEPRRADRVLHGNHRPAAQRQGPAEDRDLSTRCAHGRRPRTVRRTLRRTRLRWMPPGRARKVVFHSAPRYPGAAETIKRMALTTTYEPTLRDCVPVAATVETASNVEPPTWQARFPRSLLRIRRAGALATKAPAKCPH